ncbi:MAG: hypothetical protein Q8Q31_06005 [Nanoarchaeota archaeon]|nr:hypothetical protein [Nanoarchaeota archaeon]
MNIHIQQIILDKKPIGQSKNFLKFIHTSDNIEGGRVFDMLDGTQSRRRTDIGMTLDKYLLLNWTKRHVRLQIGSPASDRIIYFAGVDDQEGINHFAWVDCALTESNYKEIAGAFEQAYGGKIK